MEIIDLFFSIITNFGFAIAILYLIPSIVFYNKKARKELYALWLSLFLSIGISLLLKLLISKARPDLAIDYHINILDNSFPSMHSLVAFASLPILSANFSNSKYFTVFAILVAFSRIYFGYHFLSDVIFGIFAGYLIGLFSLRIINKK